MRRKNQMNLNQRIENRVGQKFAIDSITKNFLTFINFDS